jgi:hypothetical protein
MKPRPQTPLMPVLWWDDHLGSAVSCFGQMGQKYEDLDNPDTRQYVHLMTAIGLFTLIISRMV